MIIVIKLERQKGVQISMFGFASMFRRHCAKVNTGDKKLSERKQARGRPQQAKVASSTAAVEVVLLFLQNPRRCANLLDAPRG